MKQRGIIDELCRTRIVNADVMSKGNVLVGYLLEQNDINIFKEFIKLCKIKQSKLANRLKIAINTGIKTSGLASKNGDFKAAGKPMSGKLTVHLANTHIHLKRMATWHEVVSSSEWAQRYYNHILSFTTLLIYLRIKITYINTRKNSQLQEYTQTHKHAQTNTHIHIYTHTHS